MRKDSVVVRHSQGSYSIRAASMADVAALEAPGLYFVTDANVASSWGPVLDSLPRVMVLPAGEATKSVRYLEQAWSWLLGMGADRGATVVAVGGGVIGDLAGFAAATYLRGVRFVQAPTSLLAMVDSSVGGKVGIDLPEGKNLAGAFYPPAEVIVPIDALKTLPERQFLNGMAEVWKYGFIMDERLLARLPSVEPNAPEDLLTDIVLECIEHKRGVVEADEHDRLGRRAILNFGHTVGHALEHLTGYGPLLHGEAVAVGMAVEALIGEALGVTEPGTSAQVSRFLEGAGLPTRHPQLGDGEAMMDAMMKDKKVVGGELAMSLLTRIGECKLVTGIPRSAVEAVLSAC